MRFRSHVMRPMDPAVPSNRLILGLTVVAAIAGVVVWLTDDSTTVLWAPLHVFFIWALIREIDPDHHATAIVGGIAAGIWVLAGLEVTGVLPVVGIMLAGRLVANTTGRRPLITDLVAIAVIGTAMSYTTAGFVAGFGLAIAIYIDDRMAEEPSAQGALTAALAALGSAAVATLSEVFPRALPDVRPLLAVAVGVLALVAVVREPEAPTEMVDSRRKSFISPKRLHAAMSLVAVLVFAGTLLTGQDALVMGPMVIALALALSSHEIERIRRQ